MARRYFLKVNKTRREKGLKVGSGTIVDVTIIGAPSSTENATKTRDQGMHQTRKGQQWYLDNCSCVASPPASLLSSASRYTSVWIVILAWRTARRSPPQSARQTSAGRCAPRRGSTSLWRSRLCQSKSAAPGACPACEGLHQPVHMQAWRSRRSLALAQSQQVAGPRSGRTRLRW